MITRFIIPFLLLASPLSATNWLVGPARTYTKPSAVSNLVQNGDTVSIDAGVYPADVARWAAHRLLLRGVGGIAHLKAQGANYGGKAIWVIAGDDTRVEYIEFSECTVPDQNGAGIRQEGHNLTVRHCAFHHNEDGILAGTVHPSHILVEYSEFAYNGYGDGLSHNIYVNNIDTFTFRFNYSHHTAVGHEVKSRAFVNFIQYNRITNEDGTASRNIDLPNGGTVYLIGNIIEQGEPSPNHNMIGYGLEGLSNPTAHAVYAVHNTLVNHYNGGSFIQFAAGTALFKGYNNIVAGGGAFISGTNPLTLDTAANLRTVDIASIAFADDADYDYHLTALSALVIDKAVPPGMANGFALAPVAEYLHIASGEARCVSNLPDIGAFEWCAPVPTIAAADGDMVAVFPNPSSGVFYLDMPEGQAFDAAVFTSTGACIGQWHRERHLDLAHVPAGVYFLKIDTASRRWVVKLIKKL